MSNWSEFSSSASDFDSKATMALWRSCWARFLGGDKVWYDRCNFSRGLVHCVLINYPAREERAWDDIVTRISLSLSGK